MTVYKAKRFRNIYNRFVCICQHIISGLHLALCDGNDVLPFGNLTREFNPYYEVPELEWYYIYNRIESE